MIKRCDEWFKHVGADHQEYPISDCPCLGCDGDQSAQDTAQVWVDAHLKTCRDCLIWHLQRTLKEISLGRGVFRRDQLEHAANVIEANKLSANAALHRIEEAQ